MAGSPAAESIHKERSDVLVTGVLPVLAVVGVAISVTYGLATWLVTLPDITSVFPSVPYALDGSRQFEVAVATLAGNDPYSVAGNLYPPAGSYLFAPLTPLGLNAAMWAWFIVKVALVVACVMDATQDRPGHVRALAILFVGTLLTVQDDLWLGNVSIVLGAAIYLAVARLRPWAATPLGVSLAMMAKPFLVPVVLWFVVYRRTSAITLLATAAVAALAAAILLGPNVYGDYFAALRSATGLDPTGSRGLSAVAPALLVPASIVVVGVYVFLLWRSRDEPSVLMWALLVGLVAVPYVATYSVVPVLAGVPLFTRAHPTRTLVLAAAAAPLLPISIMAATAVALVVAFPSDVLASLPIPGRLRAAPTDASSA
jgi:hypothetical protein